MTSAEYAEFAQVVNEDGVAVASVNRSVLGTFFEEVSTDKTPLEAFNEYKPETQANLLNYLTYRVMEVNPGDLPQPE